MTTRRTVYALGGVAALAAAVVTLVALGFLRLTDSLGGARPDRASAVEVAYQAGPFRLGVELDPGTPRVGDNHLTLVVQDQEGGAVTGAVVEVVAEMPAMGAMPAMRAPAEMREGAPGVYQGSFSPSMAGSWPLTVQVVKEGLGDARVTFDLATGRAGLEVVSGATMLRGGTAAAGTDATVPTPGTPGPSTSVPGARVDEGSSFRVDPAWQQAIGVRTAIVGRRELAATLRLPGRVMIDETRLVDVNLRTSGWIDRLFVEELGQHVHAGQVLLELYSPELVTAQRDLLLAIESARLLADSPSAEARDRTATLVDASRRRLRRLGLSDTQVEQAARSAELQETLPILSPSSGYVVDKMAVEGMRVEPGMRLYRIADLDTVWVLVDVYEGDASFVQPGQEAVFRLAYEPERTWRGNVDYVYPTLDAASRTIRVRLVFSNPRLELRPEMYGDVLLTRELAPSLAVPAEAVLELGTRQVVFVDLGDGRLQAREVALGAKIGDWYPIRAGLSEGDSVVVSGNFLIDAESKVRGVVPLPLREDSSGASNRNPAGDGDDASQHVPGARR